MTRRSGHDRNAGIGQKTVAEKAYILSDSTITLEADGKAVSGNITVPAGKTVSVTVTIELGDAGRKYRTRAL